MNALGPDRSLHHGGKTSHPQSPAGSLPFWGIGRKRYEAQVAEARERFSEAQQRTRELRKSAG
ncbi:hypothetical protein GCM10027074_58420 [Streptomyces deserti]